jgi:membrane-associated phospholipid phosphatase
MIIDYIGFLGPVILITISYIYMFIFKFKKKLLFTELIQLNAFLNFILKRVIKQARPQKQSVMKIPFLKKFKYNDYGMPSGHAQMAAFVTTFFILHAKKYKAVLSSLFIFVTISTLYQRYKYKAHYISQILVGTLLGISIALIGFYFETDQTIF